MKAEEITISVTLRKVDGTMTVRRGGDVDDAPRSALDLLMLATAMTRVVYDIVRTIEVDMAKTLDRGFVNALTTITKGGFGHD